MTERKIEAREIRVWETQGRLTSMAAGARPTGKGITLNLVYTPKDLRRKGFATALVADLSRIFLEEGYRFCTLFTDLDFPTSNHIYQRIGYRPVSDFLEIGFEAPEG